MVWNTIAHPKMMIDLDPGGGEPAPVGEGIKYADPHKLAFFDLLIDVSERNNPKLIHGDFETVKNKILNHELVIGSGIFYSITPDDLTPTVEIMTGKKIAYNKNANKIGLKILMSGMSSTYIISSDNTVRLYHDPIDDAPGSLISNSSTP